MKLAKPIYENLPYLYFLLSGFLLVNADGGTLLISAALFYCAGCTILVTRSSHRRLDKRLDSKKHKIPELIYEYLPYGYGAIAIFTIMGTVNPYFQFAAFALGVYSVKILLFRHNNRSKPKALF